MREINPQRGEMPIQFFDKSPAWGIPQKGMYKVYHDGSHYVATLVQPRGSRRDTVSDTKKINIRRNNENAEADKIFDKQCDNAVQDGLKGCALQATMCKEMQGVVADVETYVKGRLSRRWHNLHARKKRFQRKAQLNKWNYFVTITYDERKHNAEQFRTRLRKCLSNFATRRGWRYMGVFEKAPETGRLHFHALMFIPRGQMPGKVYARRDYSTASHDMQTTSSNTFFEKTFGRNDFSEINEADLKRGNSTDYLLKYIGKTGERIVYSRKIKDSISIELTDNEIACEMTDYVQKYVLFDNVIDWARDVAKFTYEQQSFLRPLKR